LKENPRIGNRVVPCGRKTDRQTDKHDETNVRFRTFTKPPPQEENYLRSMRTQWNKFHV